MVPASGWKNALTEATLTIAPPPVSSIAVTAGAGGAQRAEEVQPHRPFELLVAGAEEAVHAQAHRADVVHEHVDPPVLLQSASDQLRGAVRGSEVDRDRGHPVEPVEGVGAAGAGDHEGAFTREGAHDRESDALARAGDDGDLAIESEVHGPVRPIYAEAAGVGAGAGASSLPSSQLSIDAATSSHPSPTMARWGRPSSSRYSVAADECSYFLYCAFDTDAGTVWSFSAPTISSGARCAFLKCTSVVGCRAKFANPAS